MSSTYSLDVRDSCCHLAIYSSTYEKCISVPERELEVRKDLRAERIFTIDPDSAKDLDDAVSVKVNEDGTYDIGVHVADVSFFVKPNTALDRDARKRATSVYLVQRNVPMLPPTLSEQLCSILPGQERLAFSVIFTMTKEGKVTKKWFGRTIIKSAAKLAYSEAQAVIEGKTLGNVAVIPEHQASDIAHDIKVLDDLAKQLRERRFQNGSLHSDSMRLTFQLDDNGVPSDCKPFERNDANDLVEEVCILYNLRKTRSYTLFRSSCYSLTWQLLSKSLFTSLSKLCCVATTLLLIVVW